MAAAAPQSARSPELLALLADFAPELDGAAPAGPFSDAAWLAHLELRLALRALCAEALRALRRAVESRAQARLADTPPGSLPLVLRVVDRYRLTPREADLFQLLFVRGATVSQCLRSAFGGKYDDKELHLELCSMSTLDLEDFVTEKRLHMVDGIIVEQGDEYEDKNLRMTREAVAVLLGRSITSEQRLKLTHTELLAEPGAPLAKGMESGLSLESEDAVQLGGGPAAPAIRILPDLMTSDDEEHNEEELDGDIASQLRQLEQSVGAKMAKHGPVRHSPPQASDSGPGTPRSSAAGAGNHTAALASESSKGNDDANGTLDGDEQLGLYKSSLEYLDDAFQTSSIRELRAKLRFAQSRLQERLRTTELAVASYQLPRLEALARKLGLDDFEKFVVLMLVGAFEVDGEGSYRRAADGVQVKDVLTVQFESFKEQVLARKYFYKSSKLVAKGLVKVKSSLYARGSGDLMEQQLELDRRLLDWIAGLDTEITELIEGSHLYTPKVGMEQVVLPEEQKELLVRSVENFGKFRTYRKTAGMDDTTSGAGLVVLLSGASGTGKTMTVNAVAHHLGKRVLLVDFQSLYSPGAGLRSRDEDQSSNLRGLFREAEMNDAVLFFDECEAIFAQREKGGDAILSSLLTEIEKHEGIIMLATNRPLDLDEAMHRRIMCVSEFRPPDHIQRRKIWKLVTARLPLSVDIDWDLIALRYELTGGYIKNAAMSALLQAISRDAAKPVVTMADIMEGCSLQMRGSLQMKSFSHRVVPTTGLDNLQLSTSLRASMAALVEFEKARGVLVVNCAQLLVREGGEKGSSIGAVFKDARLMDAVLVLDDFQIMASEEEGSIGSVSVWAPRAIGLVLHELERFPGLCILIANHAQAGMVHRLDSELVRRLKHVVEFKQPDAAVRARMWRTLLPAKVPLSEDVDFEELGRRFEFTSSPISSATVRAAAKAALREEVKRKISQADLIEAAEVEKRHRHDEAREEGRREPVCKCHSAVLQGQGAAQKVVGNLCCRVCGEPCLACGGWPGRSLKQGHRRVQHQPTLLATQWIVQNRESCSTTISPRSDHLLPAAIDTFGCMCPRFHTLLTNIASLGNARREDMLPAEVDLPAAVELRLMFAPESCLRPSWWHKGLSSAVRHLGIS
eukprot:SM000005S17202  [mRNA]  locus=s5:714075:723832:- [translate_table: standard]